MERKKIELRSSSAAIGNASFVRHTTATPTNAGVVKDRVAVPNHLEVATAGGQRKGG
jgi:hypothetical protein